jgi:transcriptional regulator with XRE-family HTH domain
MTAFQVQFNSVCAFTMRGAVCAVSRGCSMTETLGHRLRQLRGTISQDEFASRLGVHKETVGKYERDKILPGSDVLTTLRQEWRADINWLLTGEGGDSTSSGTASGDMNPGALGAAAFAVQEMLHERQRVLPPEKLGLLITLVYKHLVGNGGKAVERGVLNNLLDLAS